MANDKAMTFDRVLTARNGLKGRPWYKNVLSAPSKTTGYGATFLPAVLDAINDKNLGDVLVSLLQVTTAFNEL